MKRFMIKPHIADMRLHVEADTLENLFEAALTGTNSILRKNFKKLAAKNTFQKEISITSSDPTALMIDFLSEIITFSHINKVIFHRVKQLTQEHITIQTGSIRDLPEEAPYAYKDIHNVIDIVVKAGIAKKVAMLKPIIVIKG